MKTTTTRISLVLAASLAASMAIGESHTMAPMDPVEAQKAREDLMKSMGKELGILGKMAKGETDFDASSAKMAADALHEAAVKAEDEALWVEGSDDMSIDDTRALPDIWDNNADFKEKGAALVLAVETLQTGAGESLQAMQAAIGPVGQACGSCHKAYRAPEE